MFDWDKWMEVASTLRRNKLRTILTACGVFWGVFMLMAMLGFGAALEGGVSSKMMGISTNSVYMWSERTSLPYKGLQPGRNFSFDNDDIEVLRQLEGVEVVSARNQLGGWRSGNVVARGEKVGSFHVMGDYPDIRDITSIKLTQGRFINPLDIKHKRKMAIIGAQVFKELYSPDELAIGTSIKINGVYFEVAGVFKTEKEGNRGERDMSTIHIPFTTFQKAFNYGDRVGWFALVASPNRDAQQVENQAKKALAERHRVHPDDPEAIGAFNAAEEFAKVQSLLGGISIFIWFVGILTLLAGVLGVSNIMLIVVKERTKELGIRKALGATPWSIVSLVVQESVVLTSLSGYAGIVVGVAMVEGLALLAPNGIGALGVPRVDLSVVLIATAILIVSGAFAGIMPARHAASIDPVEALRSE